jgi:hypothetical protein
MPSNEETVLQHFLNEPGFAKTQISLKTLCELGLISGEKGVYMSMNAPKTDLMNSYTYKKLYEGVK